MEIVTNLEVRGDYLVPVYNLGTRMRYIAEYKNGVHFVKLWAIDAAHGDETASIWRAVAEEERYYGEKSQSVWNYVRYSIVRRRQEQMKRLWKELNDKDYHKKIDQSLIPLVRRDLKDMGFKSDLDSAIFLESISLSR